jgi:ATP-dependent DNA helicase PIF1
MLNDKQSLIFEKYKNGENVFVTGPGGTGKSFLIKTIVKDAELNEKKIQVCALTGCASILLNCKAITLHRFAGFGLANKPINEVVEEVLKKKYKLKKWFNLECLIIDEVSMMSLKLLLILDAIARILYNKPNIPFGGLQVIFSGDFYQLPPVKSSDEEKEASMFCFEHSLWNELFPPDNQIVLKSIFRQEEAQFLKVLKYVRQGRITNTTKASLESRVF